jgi:hypothetical protein
MINESKDLHCSLTASLKECNHHVVKESLADAWRCVMLSITATEHFETNLTAIDAADKMV